MAGVGRSVIARLVDLERFDVLLTENPLTITITRIGPFEAEIVK